jgi:zeaxanthin glucosyltransferase
MITHGGTGSLRECIFFGVPMIAMAHMRDHVGNAARVVYHGLGVREDPRKVTAEQLARDIEHLLTDEATRERVRAMQKEFRRLEAERPSLAIVERYLRSGAEA